MRAVTTAMALVAAILVSATAACGEDEQGVRTAFADVRRAWLAEDYDGVCRYLSSAAKREVGLIGHGLPTRCARDVAARMSATILTPRDRVEPPIESVEIDGDAATVVAQLGGTTPSDVRFVKEDGRWKLDRVFGITASPPEDLG